MATLTRYQTETQNKEIGDLLLKVQDELRGIRTLIGQENTKIDLKSIQTSLQKTENEIKEKADNIINQLNSQVKTLPTLDAQELSSNKYTTTLETIWDLAKRERNVKSASITRSSSRGDSAVSKSLSRDYESLSNRRNEPNVIEEVQEISVSSNKYVSLGLSPGQQIKVERETRALFNPENNRNRIALNENYNIQLPLIEKRSTLKVQTHIITGSTVGHLATLPLAYRRNPALLPPSMNENEARHGLLNLIERGLIPPTAKLTFDELPFVTQSIKPTAIKPINLKLKEASSKAPIEAFYKLDPNYESNKNKENQSNELKSKTKLENSKFSKKKTESQIKFVSSTLNKMDKNVNNENNNNNNTENPLPPPVTPSNALQLQVYDSSKVTHRFVIQHGRTRTDKQEFITFKNSFCLRWGSIVTIIKYLEELCQTYTVPLGLIDGIKVSEVSRCIEMDLKPTLDDLLNTFVNKDEVEKLVRAPGRRFVKKGGANLAATLIQSTWRGHRDRSAYLQYRKRKWAAGVIALTWLTYCKVTKAREKLKITRETQLENFRRRQREFYRNWPKLKNSKRVIIHLPSLGYNESIRNKMSDLRIRESYQMTRLCDICDENVDVIYVSPIQVTEETLQYYIKLFGLRPAVLSGDVNEQCDFSNRYKIVIPEAINSFPNHNMALSTLMKYSPKALQRIRNLIKGRDAYLVPGIMNHDDIHVADELNIPILGCEPEISNLYSTKSGSKRIFQSAKISIPYGEFDIYNKDQLYECLAQAITENLTVQRWIFKLDDECDGRGIAYCDISRHLSCYNWALKEMAKFGDKWTKRWAYEPTYVKILEELPEVLNKYAKPANTQIYSSWEAFQKAFLSQGGVLEAHPPSDSVTSLTVSLLIEPDQTVKIFSSGDHIHAESPYSCWGISFPQTSVEPVLLNDACNKIIEACKQRNIVGYVDIDFVTYIDPKTEKQVLWATDLNISYSDHVAMISLLFYLTNGKFDASKHLYEVSVLNDKTKAKKSKATPTPESNLRYSVTSAKLYHTNLSVIHYSVFFQTCRALGIGYDIKEKQGTIFSLVDSINHVHMGMVTITDNLRTALQQFSHNLSSLHHEISSTNMQGNTNFLFASNDIKYILNATSESDETNLSTNAANN